MSAKKKARAQTRTIIKQYQQDNEPSSKSKTTHRKKYDQDKNSEWDTELQNQIDSPAPVTGRNNEIISLASKMIWANHKLAIDSETLFSYFRERYPSDITDSEIKSDIKSAERYNTKTKRDSSGTPRKRQKVGLVNKMMIGLENLLR